MSFSLLYHPNISDDVKRLDKQTAKRISSAILSKLTSDPYRFGKPLQYSLKGARSLRIGDYRVLYFIGGKEVWILAIFHRRTDYLGLEKRLTWKPR